MNTLLGLVVSSVSAVLQFVATLNVGTTSWLLIHQPKAPKSLLK